MEEEVIELRGHHIDWIAERLFERSKTPVISKVPDYADIHANKKSQLYDTVNYDIFKKDGNSETFSELCGYPLDFTQFSHETREAIIINPNLKIKIVRGFDSLCAKCWRNPDSPDKVRKCDPQIALESRQDARSLEEFGLVEGKTYTSAEIISAIKAYQMLNNVVSPRRRDADSINAS